MYNSYFNPYQNLLPTQMSVTPQQITRVNGENGARAFQMAPNSSALLLDESNPIVWLSQSDGAGYKTVTPYRIEPYQPEPQPDYKSLSDRITRLEGLLNESNTSNAEQKSNQ